MVTRQRLVVALLALVAFALALVATRSGPGVSPDSVSYLAAARGLADGRGLVDFDGSVFNHWPPGFPVAIAGFDLLGVSGDEASRFLNAALLAAVVVLSWALLRRHVESAGLVLFGTAVVALCPALLRTADMVWSEPLFTVVILAFALVLGRACERDRLSGYAVAGVLVSAAVLVRYLGFALALAGALAILLTKARGARRRAVGYAAWFSAWALIGPALWAVRNLAHSEPVLGRQPSGSRSVLGAAVDVAEGVGRLAVPDGVARGAAAAAGVIAALMVLVVFVIALRNPDGRSMIPVVLVAGTAVPFTLVSRVTAASDASARILAPYVPFLVVVALWLYEDWRAKTARAAPRCLVRVVTVLGALGLAAFVAWSVGLAYDHGRDGQQYASSAWERSELVRAVARLPEADVVYSNNPLPISYAADRDEVGVFLGPGQANPFVLTAAAKADLAREACVRPVRVVWFGADDPGLGGTERRYGEGVLISVRCHEGL